MPQVRVALCQINCRVGDIRRNVSAIRRGAEKALKAGASVVCFPELAVCGYPPEDLLLKPGFTDANAEAVRELKSAAYPLTMIVGFAERARRGGPAYNAAAVISGGGVAGVYRKSLLPNYGVFDENRYFESGSEAPVFRGGGLKMGVTVCEDIWFEGGPAARLAKKGANLMVNISASPYSAGKPRRRERMLSQRAAQGGAPLVFCNLVGGQDELVFDGHSAIFNSRGETVARARGFREDIVVADVEIPPAGGGAAEYRIRRPQPAEKPPVSASIRPLASNEEEVFSALVLGTRDYVRKNGFKTAVIGLSGGIDSALVAAIGVEALGSDRVAAFNMPSVFSSKSGVKDAEAVAKNLGISLRSVSIRAISDAYGKGAPEIFKQPGLASENIQARIRGNILMGFSNRFGSLVLTTGNKSESAVGYSTLYGDTAGGFAVIKDVKKTLVYRLARHYNSRRGFDAIPEAVIGKPPTAELRRGQKDSDDLPPYEVLDEIITHYVERDKSVAETVKLCGASRKTVVRIARLIDGNEYKRRQSPPGIRLTDKAFGKDRRMPITNLFRD